MARALIFILSFVSLQGGGVSFAAPETAPPAGFAAAPASPAPANAPQPGASPGSSPGVSMTSATSLPPVAPIISANALLKLRDPFKRPQIQNTLLGAKSELETIPVEQFKMLGVLTGPEKVRAMIAGPSGKTYFVSENMKVGVHRGWIKRITPQSVVVREKIVNLLGKEEEVDSVVSLPEESKTSWMKAVK